MSPNSEPDWHAHYNCAYCHGLKAKADIIFVDDAPVCRHGDGINSCREKYHAANHPRSIPRSIGFYDKG